MKIMSAILVLLTDQNMSNIHVSGKLALGYNSTLVSEAKEEIQEIRQGKKQMKPQRAKET